MKLEQAAFGVHGADGTALGVIECPTDYTWSREINEVSRLSLNAPIQELAEQIVPWSHWVSCWHGQALQWVGPILDAQRDRTGMALEARDPARYMWETRTPTTRRWDQLDVAPIAADLWRDMQRVQGLDGDPVVLPALASQGRYNFSVTADQRYVHQDMGELSKMGVRWTVVKGRAVIGHQPLAVVAELDDCDMTAGAKVRRSGARTKNDVRVQGKNFAHTEYVPLAGLRLQSIVSLDDLGGVNNIQRAAAERAQRSARIRDELIVPSPATLTPDAPIELDDLVPGVHVAVTALGIRSVLRVDKVQVSGSSTGVEVSVVLSTPEIPDELERAGGQVVS
ncbi:hypothetical protein [Nocardia cyriacigeorgica]|uniref:hypothetical protein n=1 Tax=Nocardia cyriacigeorgica TaxID=135487 RepID=UPI002456B3DB|nr:hypothetical protein [Nocardia cyriacigeorgica]